jgi:hypothetical protein
MRYIPSTATCNLAPTRLDNRYDLGDGLIEAVNYGIKSLGLDRTTSPEAEFLNLVRFSPEEHKGKIKAYVDKVNERLKTKEGVLEYMKVAESNRRLFRPHPRTQKPLHPLAEFDMSLPYANKIDAFKHEVWSMKPDGTVQCTRPEVNIWHPRNTQTHFSASGCPFSASF